MISVLCANKDSIYKSFPELDVWDKERNVYRFNGKNPVITHAPCQQWSSLKYFAKNDPLEKNLAWLCLNWVNENGGVFEHPAYSDFFKEAEIDMSKVYSVDQHWWGLECKKPTWLYFSKCKPLPYSLSFDAVTHEIKTGINKKNALKWMDKKRHSFTTKEFAEWLIKCVSQV